MFDPASRLEIDEIKRHRFFYGIDWQRVGKKDYVSLIDIAHPSLEVLRNEKTSIERATLEHQAGLAGALHTSDLISAQVQVKSKGRRNGRIVYSNQT